MKNTFHLLVLTCSLLPFAAVAAERPHAAFQQAVRDYEAGDFAAAAAGFQTAAGLAQENPKLHLPAGRARYNAAISALSAGDLDSAASGLVEGAQRLEDLDAQARAFYNLGNMLYAQADAPEAATDLNTAGENIGEALSMYERALTLKPDLAEAKANYELASLKQQEIQQQQQQQQQDQQDQQQDPQDGEQDGEPQSQESEGNREDPPGQPPQESSGEDPPGEGEEPPQDGENQDTENQDEQQAQPRDPGEMTPEEAERLLDAMRAQEQARRDETKRTYGNAQPVEKDW